jgi:hypothetical protein
MFFLPAILAFGFANLAMLGWLGAAAAPIVIHLLSRRKYYRMPWAAMEYLLAALRESNRRLRLEQWLLLAIRVLLIVLVVLAVAEPFLSRAGLALVAGQRTHRVLVIDASYSMGYKPTDKTRFERAKELAARIVEESPQGDGFTLVLLAAPPRVVVGTPALDKGDFLREIDSLRLLHTSADLPATLARVEEMILAARREQPRLAAEEVYFLTDLGRVGWLPELPDAAAMAAFRQRAERLARSASLVVIDLGQAGAENVAVTGAQTAEPFATPTRNVTVEAEVKNFGRQARSRQLVELLADGRRVRQEYVDLAPGGQATVHLPHRFESPGDHTLEVRAEGDALDVDNHRYVALDVKQQLSVLCVDGRPSGGTFQGAADYLVYALEPRPDASGRALVRSEVVPESALLERDLAAYDCIFLCDVAQFTSHEAQVLDAYLKGGGGLVFFLGERIQADRYNRELGGEDRGAVHILPARLGKAVAEPRAQLDPLDYRHPIVRAFRANERSGLLTTPVSKYVRLMISKDSKAKVVLALTGRGDPLIVEEPIHRGRVILVATSADTSWTPMPLWPSYVPIVQELLAYAVGGQIRQRNLEVGQPLGATLPAATADSSLELLTPDGRTQQIRPRADGDYAAWSYGDTATSGIYCLQSGASTPHGESYAVNVNTVESDLTKLSAEELRDEVWAGVPFTYQTSWENMGQQPIGHASHASPLPLSMLYTALVLLLAETLLAWRFGHHGP